MHTPLGRRRGRRRPANRSRRGRIALLGLLPLLVVLLMLATAADPHDQARADGGLIPGVPDPGDVLGVVGDVGGSAAVSGMKSILEQLFGGIQAKLTTAVLQYLVKIPDFSGGHVADLSTRMTAMAVALVGVVATVSIIRYSASGFLGGGDAFAGLEGLMRTAGSVLLVLAWAPLFRLLVQLANGASTAVLAGSEHDLADLFRAAIVGHFALGGVGWIISIVIALAGSTMLLALIALKVALSITTVLLFVVMPVVIVLSALPEMAWVGRLAMRALVTCLAIPFTWAALFASAGAVTVDAITFSGGGGLLNQAIVKPLAGVVILFMTVSVPKMLMKAATIGGGPGGGMVSRAASYAAGRSLYDGVSDLKDSLGGGEEQSSGQPAGASEGAGQPQTYGAGEWLAPVRTGHEQASASISSPWGTAATVAAGAATGGAGAAAGAAAASGTGAATSSAAGAQVGAMGSWAPPKQGSVDGAAGSAAQGTSSFAPQRFNAEQFDAEWSAAQGRRHESPPTQQDTADAVQSLSNAQREWAAGQVLRHSDSAEMQARNMAHAATTGELEPEQRAAFRTLAASPDNLAGYFTEAAQEEAQAGPTGAPAISLPADPGEAANSAFGSAPSMPPEAEAGAATPPEHLSILDDGRASGQGPATPTRDGENPFKD
jgi:hypothetical protein